MKNRIVPLLLAALLIAGTVFFTGCGKKSIPESTKEESTIIGSVGEYGVPMEIYRYVALNSRADYENGSSDVWLGEKGAELLEKLNASVDETVVRLYTTLAMCKEYGISPDDEYITAALDAKMSEIVATYGNDYEKYTSDLSAYHMNDSVYRFLVRNDILSEELLSKMISSGEIPAFSEKFADTVRGEGFIRVKQILISSSGDRTDEENEALANIISAKLSKGEDFDALIGEYGEDVFMFNNPDGYYISRGSFLSEFEDAAFSLSVGEVSGVIKTPAGLSFIKRYEKDDSYIDANLVSLYETYRDGLYNLALEEKKAELHVEWNEKAEQYTVFTVK